MNKNSEFIKNSMILLMGRFATQFMSFFLLPLYTHFLLTEDFGFVDLIQTYISLLIPILTLRFDSAVFRFLVDERKKTTNDGKKSIISNVLFTITLMITIFLIIYVIIGFFTNIEYYWFIGINIIAIMLSNILLQISRGVGNNKEYSIASVITGFTTLLVNIILILLFNVNASSILISSTVANLLCCIYIIINNKLFSLISIKLVNKRKIIELLKYSLPMIPNALSWWIVNVSDRTIISIVLGTAYNGIYTVSCKFSNILNSIFSIFNMSWQESASLHIDDDDRDIFFSNMINKLLLIFSCISILIISIIPLCFNILIGEKYFDAYTYIPILMVANVFQISIQLFGGIYIAKKLTKQIMNTTILSAIFNIIINVALIKSIGLYAACISTLVSYIILSIYRYIDVKKYVKIKLNFKKMVMLLIIFIVCSIFYYLNDFYLNIVSLCIATLYSLIMNKDIIFHLKQKIIKKSK